jgi:predicted AAA+ superfamily ATPase
MVYERKKYKEIRKFFSWDEILILTGMRRVGKTTLLKLMYDETKSSNKVLLNMDNPLDQRLFEEPDYNNITGNLSSLGINTNEKAYIFIDEIQNFPGIVLPIKYLYDHYDIKFFVTGSSSYYLKNLFPESLAGRKVIVELFPLDFEEFLIFKEHPVSFSDSLKDKCLSKQLIRNEKLKIYYDEYLKYGGFPQVVLAETKEKKEVYLNEIFSSYFEKDVKSLADFKHLGALRDLILLLMKRIGSKLDISKLASTLGISRPSVYSYLSFLEQTYFIFLINPYSTNVNREMSGAKKAYLCDTGLLNFLSKTEDGAVLENAVFNNLRKFGKINYFQNRHGSEIDFILSEHSTAIEVKSKAIPQHINKLKRLTDTLGLADYYVVAKDFMNSKSVIQASYL